MSTVPDRDFTVRSTRSARVEVICDNELAETHLEERWDQADQTQHHHLGDQSRILDQARNTLPCIGVGIAVTWVLRQSKLSQDVPHRRRDVAPTRTSRSGRQQERQPADPDDPTGDIHPAPGDEAHSSHDQESSPYTCLGGRCGFADRLIRPDRRGRLRIALDGGPDDGQRFREYERDQRRERPGEHVGSERSERGDQGQQQDSRDGGQERADEDVLRLSEGVSLANERERDFSQHLQG